MISGLSAFEFAARAAIMQADRTFKYGGNAGYYPREETHT